MRRASIRVPTDTLQESRPTCSSIFFAQPSHCSKCANSGAGPITNVRRSSINWKSSGVKIQCRISFYVARMDPCNNSSPTSRPARKMRYIGVEDVLFGEYDGSYQLRPAVVSDLRRLSRSWRCRFVTTLTWSEIRIQNLFITLGALDIARFGYSNGAATRYRVTSIPPRSVWILSAHSELARFIQSHDSEADVILVDRVSREGFRTACDCVLSSEVPHSASVSLRSVSGQ